MHTAADDIERARTTPPLESTDRTLQRAGAKSRNSPVYQHVVPLSVVDWKAKSSSPQEPGERLPNTTLIVAPIQWPQTRSGPRVNLQTGKGRKTRCAVSGQKLNVEKTVGYVDFNALETRHIASLRSGLQ